ncbi:MAG: hypothetical protein HKO65_03860 [Gemmatimonadetes bacterium]|nr:hypothetical protein [Gemmatimonadota bacterium]NNM04215.1 hypothetical protein [Gemmatimonadota bacterium]
MRKCAVFSVALLAVLSFMLPTQASAQGAFVGAGVTFPTGDYSDFGDGDGAKTGWLTMGGVSFPLADGGLSVFGEGFFGSNSHEEEGDKTNLYGAMGGVLFDAAEEGEAGLYAFGQAGFLVHSYKSDSFEEGSETGLAFAGGAGYGFPLGGVSGWIEGRYTHALFDDGNTTYFGFLAGLSFPLGGGDG